MRALRFLCVVGIFCCASLATLGQQPTSSPAVPTTSDPQAIALVQRALTALTGGVPVSDVTLTGTAQRIAGSDDESGTATLKATTIGDSLVNLSFTSGSRTEIRNPANSASGIPPAGQWSGPDGVAHPMANHNLLTDPVWFFPVATLSSILSSQSNIVTLIGQETHNGLPAWHVQVYQPLPASSNATPQIAALMQDLTQMDLYLDPTTLLPLALGFDVHPDVDANVKLAAEIRFANYTAVNGVQVPYHVQKYLNNGLILDLQFTNASLNTGLTAATFQIQ